MPHISMGSIIAGYRIESTIGRGGMGMVFLATQLSLGRSVALKVITPDLADDDGFRLRFLAESEVMASIDHPNVVPVYEAAESDGLLFLAMRYVDGPDLGALVRAHGRLPFVRAAHIVRQIAAGLDAAHGRGLVHRDVKPANSLVADAGRSDHVYLGDFGLTQRSSVSSEMTPTGQLIGTAGYVAPEQVRGEKADARSDVYSLACVLFETITGRPPFVGDNDLARIWAHINEPPPLVRDLVDDVPPALDEVLRRGLAKDPRERFQTAGDLGAAAVAATGNGVPTTPPARRVSPGGPVSPSRAPAVQTSGERAFESARTRGARVGGACGIASVGIFLITQIVVTDPPDFNAPASAVRDYYLQQHTALTIDVALGTLAALLFLGFLSGLRYVLIEWAELQGWALLTLGAGAGFVVMLLLDRGASLTLIRASGSKGGDDVIRFLQRADFVVLAPGGSVLAGLMTGALSRLMLRGGQPPRALWIAGLVLAPLNMLAFAPLEPAWATNFFGLAFEALAAWLVVCCVWMITTNPSSGSTVSDE